ncbi:unnamed protein product [Victoria cruziana]
MSASRSSSNTTTTASNHQQGAAAPWACPHLSDYREKHGLNGFRVLARCLRIRPPGRASIRRDLKEVPRCDSCGADVGRLYACLICATVSCWRPPDSWHACAHAQASPGHEIAVDVDRAELFCCICRDQVYDRDFDTTVVLAQKAATELPKPSPLPSPPPPQPPHPANGIRAERVVTLRKRQKVVDYRPWMPDSRERALMGRGSIPLNAQDGGVWGLRGLNNLGNTCFMNSVLQALLHTPPLRNYFLSDRHNNHACRRKTAARTCLACDLDSIFSAVFSGNRMPYSPARLLHSWWQHAANLASYEQQDAHEFFISMLDAIHEREEPSQSNIRNGGHGDCGCIAHKVFSGILRSDVTCTVCGFTSTTYDPCVDISLDLEPSHGSGKITNSKSYNGSFESDSVISSQSLGISTLRGCLDRFTRPEKLGTDQKFYCQHCKVRQESLKQMSIRKLPLVSCFHIKRFEHSSTRNMSRKVDRYLQFPFSLDMSPYLSSSIIRSRFGNRIFSFDGDEVEYPSGLSPQFELFAVVTHAGKLDAGHYVTYLRLSDQWYKCDDAWITQVSDGVVRAAQGYMMFYVQQKLFYKASDNLAAPH